MNDEITTSGFGDGETCEYCGGPILEKQVTVHRQVRGQYYLFEQVRPASAKNVVHVITPPTFSIAWKRAFTVNKKLSVKALFRFLRPN